jgi:hypothetical protein
LVEPHRALPLFHREDGYFTIGKCFVAESAVPVRQLCGHGERE